MKDNNIAIFLDRDGTLIEDAGYLSDPAGIKFLPGSLEALKMFREAGLKVALISNQSGVARGFFEEETVLAIQEEIAVRASEAGAFIDAMYFCPHHPEGKIGRYRRSCACRKPEPGMILEAARDLGVDLARSFLLGDKVSDMEAAKRAGCRAVLVCSGEGRETLEILKTRGEFPELVADDLMEAARLILEEVGEMSL